MLRVYKIAYTNKPEQVAELLTSYDIVVTDVDDTGLLMYTCDSEAREVLMKSINGVLGATLITNTTNLLCIMVPLNAERVTQESDLERIWWAHTLEDKS